MTGELPRTIDQIDDQKQGPDKDPAIVRIARGIGIAAGHLAIMVAEMASRLPLLQGDPDDIRRRHPKV